MKSMQWNRKEQLSTALISRTSSEEKTRHERRCQSSNPPVKQRQRHKIKTPEESQSVHQNMHAWKLLIIWKDYNALSDFLSLCIFLVNLKVGSTKHCWLSLSFVALKTFWRLQTRGMAFVGKQDWIEGSGFDPERKKPELSSRGLTHIDSQELIDCDIIDLYINIVKEHHWWMKRTGTEGHWIMGWNNWTSALFLV